MTTTTTKILAVRLLEMIMIIPAMLVDGLEFIFYKTNLPFSFYTIINPPIWEMRIII